MGDKHNDDFFRANFYDIFLCNDDDGLGEVVDRYCRKHSVEDVQDMRYYL